MAENIAGYFHAEERVHVISNACISGVSALIAGKRMIENGIYRRVIVAGGDLLSHFITSGFGSFRSLSSRPCRPYDSSRDGLNLGEACGAVLLSSEGTEEHVILSGGAVSNDANHISGPSRTGDGLYFAIRQAMQEAGTAPQDISFVNAHGTATLYNDEMESKALTLAHLEQVPVHSLKPYFGHTLGASGIIESIVCMHELKQGILFGTPGYETPGVPIPISVYATHQHIPMKHCVKTASGFGGCNAAIVLSLPEYAPFKDEDNTLPEIRCTREVRIENSSVFINNELIFHSEEPDFGIFIRDTYKKSGGNNMKFYKMDDLCKLGYVAAEYLLKDKTFAPLEMGMLLANATSSLHTDIRHQQLIDQDGDRAASPTEYLYTQPKEVSGVNCIKELIFHTEEPHFGTFIRDTYKKTCGNNLKFYKMDDLCKLGYVAAEYLLEGKTFAPLEMGMLLANAASSLHTDIRHQQLIDREGDQAASPAVFVYTLPNVVSGEICIRHKIQGENTFFITEAYQPEKLERYARIVMQKGKLNYCIIGWCELWKNTYKAVFKLIEKQ